MSRTHEFESADIVRQRGIGASAFGKLDFDSIEVLREYEAAMPPGDDVIATLDVSSTSPRKSQTDGEGAAKSIVGGVKTSMEV
jgi:hypothetical protein